MGTEKARLVQGSPNMPPSAVMQRLSVAHREACSAARNVCTTAHSSAFAPRGREEGAPPIRRMYSSWYLRKQGTKLASSYKGARAAATVGGLGGNRTIGWTELGGQRR